MSELLKQPVHVPKFVKKTQQVEVKINSALKSWDIKGNKESKINYDFSQKCEKLKVKELKLEEVVTKFQEKPYSETFHCNSTLIMEKQEPDHCMMKEETPKV